MIVGLPSLIATAKGRGSRFQVLLFLSHLKDNPVIRERRVPEGHESISILPEDCANRCEAGFGVGSFVHRMDDISGRVVKGNVQVPKIMTPFVAYRS